MEKEKLERMSLLETKLTDKKVEEYVQNITNDLLKLREHLRYKSSTATDKETKEAELQEVADWINNLVGFGSGCVSMNFPSTSKVPKLILDYCKQQAITEFLKKFDDIKDTVEYLEEVVES